MRDASCVMRLHDELFMIGPQAWDFTIPNMDGLAQLFVPLKCFKSFFCGLSINAISLLDFTAVNISGMLYSD